MSSRGLTFVAILLFLTSSLCQTQAAVGGVKPNDAASAHLLELLEEAEQGNARSQFQVSGLYESGKGFEKNKDEALHWLMESANQGYVEAESVLGTKYEKGELVEKNDEEAVKWYTRAAEQDDAWAQSALGYRKIMGRGAPKDLDEGIRLLHAAAEQGEPHAQYYLGVCYREGVGVRVDRVQAYLWLNLSAAQNHNLSDNAKEKREELEKEMIPVQVAEAQQLSTVFLSKKLASNDVAALPNIKSVGAGFFISTDGYLLTTFHVLENSNHVTVRTANGVLPAEVIKLDPIHDIALLKVNGRFDALPLGDSQNTPLGTTVRSIQFANAPAHSVPSNIVTGKIENNVGFQQDPIYFQTSLITPPGNSGAALINELGNVVAIGISRADAASTYKISGDLPKDTNYGVKIEFSMPVLKNSPKIAENMPFPVKESGSAIDMFKKLENASAIVYSWQ